MEATLRLLLVLALGLSSISAFADVELHLNDEEGRPLTGLVVGVEFAGGAVKLQPPPDGRYSIPVVPGDKFTVHASDPVSGTEYAPASGHVPLGLDGPLVLVLAAQGAGGSICSMPEMIELGETVSGNTAIDGGPEVPPDCFTSVDAPGVWFRIRGTGGRMTASTCNQADYDTKINVYCDYCDPLVCIAGNDDGAGCAGFTSEASWCSEAVNDYLIFVQGWNGDTGAFDLTVTSDEPGSCTVFKSCFDLGGGPGGQPGACCTCLNSPYNCTVGTLGECEAIGGDWQGSQGNCDAAIREYFGPPVAIPDGTHPLGVELPLTVFSGPPVIADVDVGVVIHHSWRGDLWLTLEHPDTTQVSLWQSGCDSGAYANLVRQFDDEATDPGLPDPCALPSPCDTGSFGAEGCRWPPAVANGLAAFDGKPAVGDWRLFVGDDSAGNAGTLIEWYLSFSDPLTPNVCTQAPAGPQTTLCHCPPGLGGTGCHTITVGESGASRHLLNHGDDRPGACGTP